MTSWTIYLSEQRIQFQEKLEALWANDLLLKLHTIEGCQRTEAAVCGNVLECAKAVW